MTNQNYGITTRRSFRRIAREVGLHHWLFSLGILAVCVDVVVGNTTVEREPSRVRCVGSSARSLNRGREKTGRIQESGTYGKRGFQRSDTRLRRRRGCQNGRVITTQATTRLASRVMRGTLCSSRPGLRRIPKLISPRNYFHLSSRF